MSEDRLDKALEAMKAEKVSEEELAQAHDRTWQRLGTGILCVEFEREMRGYLDEKLEGGRRLLVEDHLGRCARCRASLARMKGEEKVVALPVRSARRLRWGTWAAAAALLIALVYFGRTHIESLLAPGGPRATVASVEGVLYRVPKGILKPGAAIGEQETIRTGPGARAFLRLADGSMVEVNERTELSLHAGWRKKVVRLHRGDIIVQAAKQRRGALQVQTRDSLASVKGTVFAVSTGFTGSVVSVVEGAVSVAQAGSETLLSPGEQAATTPALMTSVSKAVAWSPDAETYLAMLASVAHIERQLAQNPSPLLRTESVLLGLVPASTVLYGAVPNMEGTIEQALSLAEQQSAQNPAFSRWWDSGAGEELQKVLSRLQTIASLLGDEIVYGVCATQPGNVQAVPILLAEVQQGKHAELKEALDGLGIGPAAYRLNGSILAASNSTANLDWLTAHMGEGAEPEFAAEIAARYRDGAAWLLAVDMDSVLAVTEAGKNEFVRAQRLKHIFIEQHSFQGNEENELSFSFSGPRQGLASILAGTGTGGAAEYISSGAVAAFYVSTREPRQLFAEMTNLIGRGDPSFPAGLAEVEAKLGIDFTNELAASFGTESAFGLEGFSAAGPVWTLAVLVNDPAGLENAMGKLVQGFSAQLAAKGSPQRLVLTRETADGRQWTKLAMSNAPVSATWTYDGGYLIAGSDRGAVLRAIATRNGGSPLVWSPAFQQHLPASAGLHPSGFAWLNTGGALEGLASLSANPAVQRLISERDPILVTLNGTTEQIRAASRTRISGMLVNMLLLQGTGMHPAGLQPVRQ